MELALREHSPSVVDNLMCRVNSRFREFLAMIGRRGLSSALFGFVTFSKLVSGDFRSLRGSFSCLFSDEVTRSDFEYRMLVRPFFFFHFVSPSQIWFQVNIIVSEGLFSCVFSDEVTKLLDPTSNIRCWFGTFFFSIS